jgi:indolepyruvate decarboxylase
LELSNHKILQALKAVEQNGTGAYIEVVTDTYAAPPLAKKLHENAKTLNYKFDI